MAFHLSFGQELVLRCRGDLRALSKMSVGSGYFEPEQRKPRVRRSKTSIFAADHATCALTPARGV